MLMTSHLPMTTQKVPRAGSSISLAYSDLLPSFRKDFCPEINYTFHLIGFSIIWQKFSIFKVINFSVSHSAKLLMCRKDFSPV
jgi:hypothetical protein